MYVQPKIKSENDLNDWVRVTRTHKLVTVNAQIRDNNLATIEMFGAIFRFLVTWIPFLGRFFPDFISDADEKPRKSDLPQARVAIIGAGVGGCCASYFLRELGGDNLDIHVWQKKGVPVGGRTAVIDFAGHMYESGGSVIHTSNKYLVDFAKQFGKHTLDTGHPPPPP